MTLKLLSCVISRLCELSLMWSASSVKMFDFYLPSNHLYTQIVV